ncbi:hypothetical protein FISHEDRAFT_29912, partial [Fistulina hepatica ATCC 64428]
LTPLRAHYLKKALVQLAIHNELDAITTAAPNNTSTFSYLGPPFSPPPKDAPSLDLPFLRYIFRQFVLTFPFMAAAPKDFYSDKLQPFMASVLSRNISPTSVFDDDANSSETATRQKLLMKLERNLAMFITSATKLIEQEQVVRLTQADLDRLEAVARKRQLKNARKNDDVFGVNVVGVRAVVDKGRMRSRAHEEFIIRTRRSHYDDVFVSRRYGDFRTLAQELRKRHPDQLVPSPPAKDKTAVSAPSTSATPRNGSFDSVESLEDLASPPNSLSREKNRLTLRGYLSGLLSSSVLGSSPVLRSFLLSGPVDLTIDELEDVRRREEADRVRDDGRKRFAKEIAGRVDSLRGAVRSVKGDIMGEHGLTNIFATIKVTSNIHDLPDNYQAVIEWARMSLASTVFHMFVASDDASQTFTSLKRIHGLMPYFMLKGVLKISNPVAMIRGVIDLFLAQPFGGRSLLQRMFSSSLSEEARQLEDEIQSVKAKVEDPVICEKIRLFIYGPKEIQDLCKADAVTEKQDLITIILRSGEQPLLNRIQMQRVARASRAHATYMRHRTTLEDSDDDDGPEDEDAWLYEDLRVLAHLYSRLRDREQLIELIFEGFTADLLKDIITIFYSPLAQVYKAASIADSLGDLQSFVNDLIKTVEQVEELSQEDSQRTVQAFVSLIERHEQPFYTFVHKVHSKGQGLFDSLIRWIELFLTLVREGLGRPISLEFLLPHTGRERSDVLREVDLVAQYHYKLKLVYEDKLRKRFGKAKGEADAEDQATQAMVDSVLAEFSFGESVQGDADDLAAEEADDESDEDDYYSSSESDGSYTTSSDETNTEGSNDPHQTPRPRTTSYAPNRADTSSRQATPSTFYDVLPQRSLSLKMSPKPAPQRRKSRKAPETLRPPELKHIPTLLPVFTEMVCF